MSLALIKGLGALAFGIGYNKGYNSYQKYKGQLYELRHYPRGIQPTPDLKYAVKDMDAYEKEAFKWNKYNALRKYYMQLMMERARELDIPPHIWSSQFVNIPGVEWSEIKVPIYATETYGHNPSNRQFKIEFASLDKRFESIYNEMLDQGVTFEFRPGIDYFISEYNFRNGVVGGCNRARFPQDYEIICRGKDPAYQQGQIFMLNEWGVNNVVMDCKKFYKSQYVPA